LVCLRCGRALRGVPRAITADNGSEFASRVMDASAYRHGIQLDFIRPGKPVENGVIESFNGRLRDECLNVKVFFRLEDVRRNYGVGSRATIGFNPIVRRRIGRPRRLLPSGSGRPRRLTRTALNCWRPSREVCKVRIAAWTAQTDHAQANFSGLVQSTFSGQVKVSATGPRVPHGHTDRLVGVSELTRWPNSCGRSIVSHLNFQPLPMPASPLDHLFT
jgi:hypothetical protein